MQMPCVQGQMPCVQGQMPCVQGHMHKSTCRMIRVRNFI